MRKMLHKCLFAVATAGLAAAQSNGCINVVGQPSLPCIGAIIGGLGDGGTIWIKVNEPANLEVQIAGGTPPYTWSVVSGYLPNGLNLSAAVTQGNNFIVGTPTTSTGYDSMGAPYPLPFTLRVVDAAGHSTSDSKAIAVLGLGVVAGGTPTSNQPLNFVWLGKAASPSALVWQFPSSAQPVVINPPDWIVVSALPSTPQPDLLQRPDGTYYDQIEVRVVGTPNPNPGTYTGQFQFCIRGPIDCSVHTECVGPGNCPYVPDNLSYWTTATVTLTPPILAGLGPGPITNAQTLGGTEFCIDVPHANYSQGVTLITWACHGGENQQFTRTDAGELKIGGFCVDAYGGGQLNGNIGLWPCHGSSNQKWTLQQDGHYVGDGGFCIAPRNSIPGYGIDVIMVNCDKTAGQLWTGPANNASQAGPIANAQTLGGTQFCIDVPNANYSQGVTLITWACHGGENQQFTRTDAGELKIGGFCVDAYGGGQLNGNIGLWPCHGSSNQKWTLQQDGHYVGAGGFCVAPRNSTPGYGADVIMVNCERQNAGQLWTGPI
jgi:hypothetical protein